MARSEEGLVVGRADLEGDLGFGADEGAAGVVWGGAGGDGLAGAGRGVEGCCCCCCWGGGLLVGCQLCGGVGWGLELTAETSAIRVMPAKMLCRKCMV